jgi:hypothetical protein
MSSATEPSPAHVSQRPPRTLKLNPAGTVAAGLGEGQGGPEVAHQVHDAGEGGRIRTRAAADRLLVHGGEGGDLLEAFEAGVAAGHDLGAVDLAGRGGGEDVDRERALAGAGDAADHGERAERERCGDVLEVVLGGAFDGDGGLADGLALHDAGEGGAAGERRRPWTGGRVRATGLRRALEDDPSAIDAGARAHLDEVVGGEHHVAVMFDDEDGVAEVAQAADRADQAMMVARVQADAGFVEDVGHADEPEAELRGEAHALGFAAGERTAARDRG